MWVGQSAKAWGQAGQEEESGLAGRAQFLFRKGNGGNSIRDRWAVAKGCFMSNKSGNSNDSNQSKESNESKESDESNESDEPNESDESSFSSAACAKA